MPQARTLSVGLDVHKESIEAGHAQRQDVEKAWLFPTHARSLEATVNDMLARSLDRTGPHGEAMVPGFLVPDARPVPLHVADQLGQCLAASFFPEVGRLQHVLNTALGFQQDTPWTTYLQSEGTPEDETSRYYSHAFMDRARTQTIKQALPNLQRFWEQYFGPIVRNPDRPDCVELSTIRASTRSILATAQSATAHPARTT